jgi:hypothetical protein
MRIPTIALCMASALVYTTPLLSDGQQRVIPIPVTVSGFLCYTPEAAQNFKIATYVDCDEFDAVSALCLEAIEGPNGTLAVHFVFWQPTNDGKSIVYEDFYAPPGEVRMWREQPFDKSGLLI